MIREALSCTIYPPLPLVFNAFSVCPWDIVKVVILGQDPYHEPGQAEGLSFSVPKGVPLPTSLKNIYKELIWDLSAPSVPKHGHLEGWAKQGVLLLNTALTVRAHEANSHQVFGWYAFTDAVIQALNEQKEYLVFILWGAEAQAKGKDINTKRHLVLKSVHPSGLSASRATKDAPYGFFRNRHFSKTNEYLVLHDKTPIKWMDL